MNTVKNQLLIRCEKIEESNKNDQDTNEFTSKNPNSSQEIDDSLELEEFNSVS